MPDQLDAPWQRIVEDQLRLARAVRQALPELRVPYFAHMRLLRDGRTRDVLLAGKTLLPMPQDKVVDHNRAAKRRVLEILPAKKEKVRLRAYRELLRLAGKVSG